MVWWVHFVASAGMTADNAEEDLIAVLCPKSADLINHIEWIDCVIKMGYFGYDTQSPKYIGDASLP